MAKRVYKKKATAISSIVSSLGIKDELSVKIPEVKPPVVKKDNMMKTSSFITLKGFFKVHRGNYEFLKRNIEKKKSTMMVGPTGVGKTELVAHICDELKIPLNIFDMGTMTDPISSLVGSHIIKVVDGKTLSHIEKSRFSKIIQQPGVVLLDELPRANVQANNLLFPCLDFRRSLSMEYSFDDTEPVKIHPDCCFLATANVGSQYTGSHKLDRALIDRFMLMEIDPLEKGQAKDIIKFHFPKMPAVQLNKIIDCFFDINAAHATYDISFNLSFRHLNDVASLVNDGFTIYDSFFTICKGIGSTEGTKALESILNKTHE